VSGEAANRVRGNACVDRRRGVSLSKGAYAATRQPAEMVLWLSLRDRRLGGFKFVRQEAIGRYVVDFVCRERKLIVEVDGGQHADNAADIRRDAELIANSYRVLRFWNNEVLTNRSGVLEIILRSLNSIIEESN
jgi:very-short-patch-repair endonuclease